MPELGHVFGYGHDADSVMADSLVAGVRRTNVEHDPVALADQVFEQSNDHRADTWLGAWLSERGQRRSRAVPRRQSTVFGLDGGG